MKHRLVITLKDGRTITEDVDGTKGEAMFRAAEINKDPNVVDIQIQFNTGT